jgi:isopenicillin-N epimerase
MSRLALAGVGAYVSNGHKWLSSSKGSSFLWVCRALQPLVQPLILSHGAGHGFTSDFLWDGCHDYSAHLAIPSMVRLWEDFGTDRLRHYNNGLAGLAARMLVERWGTDQPAPPAMFACMQLIRLPASILPPNTGAATSTQAKAVQDYLYAQKIEVPIKCLSGQLYVRISAHLYNTIDDYRVLASAIERMPRLSS